VAKLGLQQLVNITLTTKEVHAAVYEPPPLRWRDAVKVRRRIDSGPQLVALDDQSAVRCFNANRFRAELSARLGGDVNGSEKTVAPDPPLARNVTCHKFGKRCASCLTSTSLS